MRAATVPRRRIGTVGPEVSVLSLGSWHTYDRMDFHDAVDLLRRAVDAGIDFYDVAVYGGVPLEPGGPVHHSYTDILFSRMVEAAELERSRYKVSAKLWLEGWPERSFADQLDRALFRLGIDHADFAVLGDIRTGTLDFARLVEELGALVASGRLGAWGVNNWSAGHIRSAHEAAAAASVPGPQLAQLKYSLSRRAIPDGDPFRRLFADTGMSLQASDIFEGGILAGKVDTDRTIGRDPGDLREAIKNAVPRVREIAAEFDATPAQLSIAFCLTHPDLATVLFGASSVEQLEQNLAALELAERHGAELRERVEELWLDRGVIDPEGP